MFQIRQLASNALSGYIHCGLIQVDKVLLRKFARLRAATISKSSAPQSADNSCAAVGDEGAGNASIGVSTGLIERHAGVLGLKACVKSSPYSIPDWMPNVLMSLADHIYDPTPIEVSLMDGISF